MLVVRDVQEAIVREPGQAAGLDPTFIGFAVILLLAIGLMFYLAIRAVDSPEADKDGEA